MKFNKGRQGCRGSVVCNHLFKAGSYAVSSDEEIVCIYSNRQCKKLFGSHCSVSLAGFLDSHIKHTAGQRVLVLPRLVCHRYTSYF